MSSLRNVEKIEREIFRQGKLSLKSVILTGRKGKNDVKLDPIYSRSYESKKYSDRSEVSQISIVTSDYVVLAYNDFEAKINEEIFISYPNLRDFKYFCDQLLGLITSKEVFTNNNQVSMKYKDYTLMSNPFGGNKSLAAIPTSIQKDQNLIKGVYLFLNSDDIYIELDTKAVFTLNEIVSSIDLLTLSNATLMLGMMSNISTGSVDSSETTFSGSTFNNTVSRNPRRPVFNKRGSTTQLSFKNQQQTVSNGDSYDEGIIEETENAFANESVNEEQENTVQDKPVNPKLGQKFKSRSVNNTNNNTAKSSTPVGGGTLSMESILNAAETIDTDGILDNNDEGEIEF